MHDYFGSSMGNSNATEHTAHFSRPEEDQKSQPPFFDPDEEDEKQFIGISDKMVERLMEESRLPEKKKKPRQSRRLHDKIYIEKLRMIDETHSEKIGILPEDIEQLVNRINVRTEKIMKYQPMCKDCEQEVIHCYDTCQEKTDCNEQVENFKKCIKEHTAQRLHDTIADIENQEQRKSRDLEKAKKKSFWGNRESLKVN